jgi:ubiquinone/menaquinone biosynthesis C-methylase UbiE
MAGADDHWVRWHGAYDDPSSSLSRRLAVVQERIAQCLSGAPLGAVRVLSLCAGDGRDLVGAMEGHPRRNDVVGLLIELDPALVSGARQRVSDSGLSNIAVVEGDASTSSMFAQTVPVDLLLLCGIFGNVSEADIYATVVECPHLLAPGGVVIWTRHRLEPDLTPTIRTWFAEEGFTEVGFDVSDDVSYGIGTQRFTGVPKEFRTGRRLFHFVGDGRGAIP